MNTIHKYIELNHLCLVDSCRSRFSQHMEKINDDFQAELKTAFPNSNAMPLSLFPGKIIFPPSKLDPLFRWGIIFQASWKLVWPMCQLKKRKMLSSSLFFREKHEKMCPRLQFENFYGKFKNFLTVVKLNEPKIGMNTVPACSCKKNRKKVNEK